MKLIEQLGEFEITKLEKGYWANLSYRGKTISNSGLATDQLSIVKWIKQVRARAKKRIEKIDDIISDLEKEKSNLLEMIESINKNV